MCRTVQHLKILILTKKLIKHTTKVSTIPITTSQDHPNNKITTIITAIIYKKTQAWAVEIMCRLSKIFTSAKITPNKLMPKEWKKSRKVFTTKTRLFRTTFNTMRQFPGKKANHCPISNN